MKYVFVFLSLSIAFTGCDGPEKNKPAAEEKAITEEPFFPVTTFIEGQIHYVDSLQALTMSYITNGKKTDTALISIKQFDSLAREFVKPDFNDSSIKQYYKENSFADQSIKGVAFNYSTTNRDLEIQRVDVVVDASAVVNDKVRSIYMEKQSRMQDTFIYKKMYWRADKNFQIITTKQWGDNPGVVRIIRVEWN